MLRHQVRVASTGRPFTDDLAVPATTEGAADCLDDDPQHGLLLGTEDAPDLSPQRRRCSGWLSRARR